MIQGCGVLLGAVTRAWVNIVVLADQSKLTHTWIHMELLSWVKHGAIVPCLEKNWNLKCSKLTRQGYGEIVGQLQSYSDNLIEKWWYLRL